MQDLDNMELVDRKIIATTILGVDVTEVYLPRELPQWPGGMV